MKTNKKITIAVLSVALMTIAGAEIFAAQNTNSVQNLKISQTEAEKIALSKVPDGKLKEIEVKTKNGQAIYEIEILKENAKHEIKIDADTGNIISSSIKTK